MTVIGQSLLARKDEEIERLRAENAELRAAGKELAETALEYAGTIDELEGEPPRSLWEAKIERLRAELADLIRQRDAAVVVGEDFKRSFYECSEERFRLREALEFIAEMPNRIGIDADCESAPAKDCWHAARAVLEGVALDGTIK